MNKNNDNKKYKIYEITIIINLIISAFFIFQFSKCEKFEFNTKPIYTTNEVRWQVDSINQYKELIQLRKNSDSLVFALTSSKQSENYYKIKYKKAVSERVNTSTNETIVKEFDSLKLYLSERYETGLNDSINKRNLVAYAFEKQECDSLFSETDKQLNIALELYHNEEAKNSICNEANKRLTERLSQGSEANKLALEQANTALKKEKRKGLFTKIITVTALISQAALFVGVAK